jgi:hypothetical protein
MLVPSASGKRREERGKYVLIAQKQEGEWKAIADCWSTDVNLMPALDPGIKPPSALGVSLRLPRK